MNTKVCTGPCGRELSATTEFFHKSKRGRFGVRSICKKCCNKKNKEIIHMYAIKNIPVLIFYKQKQNSEKYVILDRIDGCPKSINPIRDIVNKWILNDL